jgi:GntR family transcriptional regulator, rspAB operon transcriptional repressor
VSTALVRADLRPLQPRETAAGQIRQRLRTDIITGALRPGDVLQERELAAAYGVSRTPVREAFLRLADDGLLDMRPQSGTFVTLLDVAGIREALFIREAVETAAVRLAVARFSPADKTALKDNIRRQQGAEAQHATALVAVLDAEFHRAILTASGFGGAWRVVREMRDRHARLHHLSSPLPGVTRRAVAQHAAILDAILADNGALAASRLRTHIHANADDLGAVVALYPHYFVA